MGQNRFRTTAALLPAMLCAQQAAAPDGVYGLREVVEEAVAGKLSSATHSLDLR